MYDFFKRGSKTYFIYNDKHFYNDFSLGAAWKYHNFEISITEYNKAYRIK